MAETVSIKSGLIRWAIERSRLSADELLRTFPKIEQWKSGEKLPTIKQLEKFAKKTMTPLGYLFLDAPLRKSCRFPISVRSMMHRLNGRAPT